MEDLNRIPPHSVESEQSVLGSILLDKDAIVVVSEIISPEDFYKKSHEVIYKAMIKLSNELKPMDIVTISDELKKQGYLDDIGGITYLSELSTIVPTTTNVGHYADIVKKKSIIRKLIKASNEIISISYKESYSVEEMIDEAEKKILEVSQEKSTDSFSDLSLILKDTYKQLEDLSLKKVELTGINTGFKDLNKKINGLQKTDLLLVAARPAMGKTAFSLNLIQNAALKDNVSVAVFSLEMSKDQLVQRMLSAQSNVELKKIKNGNLNENDWPRIIDAMATLSSLNIHIDDTPGIKISDLRSRCRKLKMEKGLDLVLIDYLQLMEGDGNNDSRQQEISKISRSLKIIAKELNCSVVALSQLSRAPEQRSDHRPILSDLRESGAIEQDADIVMFLYRDEYYNPDSEKRNIGEVIISKNRHGETGVVELVWLSEVQKFANKARDI